MKTRKINKNNRKLYTHNTTIYQEMNKKCFKKIRKKNLLTFLKMYFNQFYQTEFQFIFEKKT